MKNEVEMNKIFMNLRKIKIYSLFWLVASIILAIGLIQDHFEDNTFDINIHDTYFVIANFHITLFLSLAYFLTGIGYWIVQRIMKGKLINILTIIHSAILNGSFLVYWLIIGYSKAFLETPFPLLFDNYQLNQTLIILSILIVLVGQLVYIINLIIGIFKKPKKVAPK